MGERKVIAIAAMTEDRVIGQVKDGKYDFPQDWSYPSDLTRFRKLTEAKPILMGRNTYFSFPEHRRPLPGRINIVASRSSELVHQHDRVIQVPDPLRFIKDFVQGGTQLEGDELWVTGGGEIYRLTMPLWNELYLSVVNGSHEGSVVFPDLDSSFVEDLSRREEAEDHTLHVFVNTAA